MPRSPMHFDQHTSTRFNEELEDILAMLLKMGGLVERQLNIALIAVANSDRQSGEQAIESDKQINEMELQIDDEAMRIIAQRQPAASDLRLLLSIIKANKDLERMGDEAQRFARCGMSLAQGDMENVRAGLVALGRTVEKQLRGALNAFARTDVDEAATVLRSDQNSDDQYERLLTEYTEALHTRQGEAAQLVNALWAARSLERIGDHCCNIAELVVFFVRGEDINHTDLKELKL
ncbi:phosphate signaling complex protein PhoU [Gammaproteobacteria bacterium]|nr:phosphate signaling complex protein PhoU [Gammaproteobacteria bacterium]